MEEQQQSQRAREVVQAVDANDLPADPPASTYPLTPSPSARKRRSDAGKPRDKKPPVPSQSPLTTFIDDVIARTVRVDEKRVELAAAQEELHDALDRLKKATSSHVDEP